MVISFLVTSCAGGWDDVKRGITGAKKNSVDEFLVQKKDPLVLPPDFENLPTPDERQEAKEKISSIEKALVNVSTDEDISSSGSSAEDSILEQIRKN